MCPILSTHLSSHEGCMSGFVNHVIQMQSTLFAMVSVFIFSIFFVLVFANDLYSSNIFKRYFLYIKKIVLPDETKVYWLAILFHAPPCFK